MTLCMMAGVGTSQFAASATPNMMPKCSMRSIGSTGCAAWYAAFTNAICVKLLRMSRTFSFAMSMVGPGRLTFGGVDG